MSTTARWCVVLLTVLWGGLVSTLPISRVYSLELPAVFSDHMILQRDMPVPIWGKAEPGQQIQVALSISPGGLFNTVADENGDWRLELPAMPATTDPITIRVVVGGEVPIQDLANHEVEQIWLKDVLVGEVWHCSGQSNMGWVVAASDNAAEEIAAADHPGLRLFTMPHRAMSEPDFAGEGEWRVCSPETVRHFSAVAYYFGRKLHQELNVPVGLVNTSWGGTPAESYTSRASLEANPLFEAYLNGYDTAVADLKRKRADFPDWEKLPTAHQDPGPDSIEQFIAPDYDDSGWSSVDLPTGHSESEFSRDDGVVWLRRTVTIPETWVGREITLRLGRIRHADLTYANGHPVGHMEGDDAFRTPRIYTVPAEIVVDTKLHLAIRVFDSGGRGGVFGSAASLYAEADDGDPDTLVDLSGNWRLLKHHSMSPEDVRSAYELPYRPNRRPGQLYNAMIHPVAPYAHRGVIWYQGESNLGRHASYDALMKAMIDDWRQLWDQPGEARDFPFLTVQLANFSRVSEQPEDASSWAQIRDAQHSTAKTQPHCYLATAVDIGEAGDIHPRNKQEVGRRLALIAQRRVYGDTSVVDQGPTFTGAEPVSGGVGNLMRLRFDHAEGLATPEGETPKAFAVRATAGGDWQWAASARIEGSEVLVEAPEEIEAPFAVRYGWANNPTDGPQGINLTNAAGLPAFPFEYVP